MTLVQIEHMKAVRSGATCKPELLHFGGKRILIRSQMSLVHSFICLTLWVFVFFVFSSWSARLSGDFSGLNRINKIKTQ